MIDSNGKLLSFQQVKIYEKLPMEENLRICMANLNREKCWIRKKLDNFKWEDRIKEDKRIILVNSIMGRDGYEANFQLRRILLPYVLFKNMGTDRSIYKNTENFEICSYLHNMINRLKQTRKIDNDYTDRLIFRLRENCKDKIWLDKIKKLDEIGFFHGNSIELVLFLENHAWTRISKSFEYKCCLYDVISDKPIINRLLVLLYDENRTSSDQLSRLY